MKAELRDARSNMIRGNTFLLSETGNENYYTNAFMLLARRNRVAIFVASLLSGRGAARAEDAEGTLTQSHISPSMLVYEEKSASKDECGRAHERTNPGEYLS